MVGETAFYFVALLNPTTRIRAERVSPVDFKVRSVAWDLVRLVFQTAVSYCKQKNDSMLGDLATIKSSHRTY